MSRIKDTIKTIVAGISNEIIVKSWFDNTDGTFTAYVNNTLWLLTRNKITVNGSLYTVKSFVNNQSITVTAISLPDVSFPIVIPVLNFIHGTIRQTDNELIENQVDMAPFVYLLESVKEKRFIKSTFAMERESTVSLFFLNSVNLSDWITDDYHTELFDPMENAVNEFLKAFPSVLVGPIDTVDTVNHTKFATEDSKGALKWLFTNEYGGIQLNGVISLKKEKTNCKTKN